MKRLLAVILFAVGCSDCHPAESATPEPSEPPGAPEALRETIPEESPSPRRATFGEEAMDRYRRMIDAYNDGDSDAYVSAFAPTLDCFYGRRSVAREAVRRERFGDETAQLQLAAVQLSVLSGNEGQVALLDRGFFSEGPTSASQGLHEKIVVLRRTDDGWQVVSETNRAGATCLGDFVSFGDVEPAAFDSCRDEMRACMGRCPCGSESDACAECRGGCRDASLGCLGLGEGFVSSDEPGEVRLASEDDVKRFLELAVRVQLEVAGSSDVDVADADARWFRSARETMGAPFRIISVAVPASCGPFLWGIGDLELYEAPLTVDAVRCTPDLSRCVGWLSGEHYDGRRHTIEVHLFLDAGRRPVVYVEEPRAHASPDFALLDRFAERRPEGWGEECPPALLALVEDRAGEDFWISTEAYSDDADGRRITRRCGADARAAIHALGDEWYCIDDDCGPYWMCGNYCRSIEFGVDGVPFAVVSGLGGGMIREEELPALRGQVACGESKFVVDPPAVY